MTKVVEENIAEPLLVSEAAEAADKVCPGDGSDSERSSVNKAPCGATSVQLEEPDLVTTSAMIIKKDEAVAAPPSSTDGDASSTEVHVVRHSQSEHETEDTERAITEILTKAPAGTARNETSSRSTASCDEPRPDDNLASKEASQEESEREAGVEQHANAVSGSATDEKEKHPQSASADATSALPSAPAEMANKANEDSGATVSEVLQQADASSTFDHGAQQEKEEQEVQPTSTDCETGAEEASSSLVNENHKPPSVPTVADVLASPLEFVWSENQKARMNVTGGDTERTITCKKISYILRHFHHRTTHDKDSWMKGTELLTLLTDPHDPHTLSDLLVFLKECNEEKARYEIRGEDSVLEVRANRRVDPATCHANAAATGGNQHGQHHLHAAHHGGSYHVHRDNYQHHSGRGGPSQRDPNLNHNSSSHHSSTKNHHNSNIHKHYQNQAVYTTEDGLAGIATTSGGATSSGGGESIKTSRPPRTASSVRSKSSGGRKLTGLDVVSSAETASAQSRSKSPAHRNKKKQKGTSKGSKTTTGTNNHKSSPAEDQLSHADEAGASGEADVETSAKVKKTKHAKKSERTQQVEKTTTTGAAPSSGEAGTASKGSGKQKNKANKSANSSSKPRRESEVEVVAGAVTAAPDHVHVDACSKDEDNAAVSVSSAKIDGDEENIKEKGKVEQDAAGAQDTAASAERNDSPTTEPTLTQKQPGASKKAKANKKRKAASQKASPASATAGDEAEPLSKNPGTEADEKDEKSSKSSTSTGAEPSTTTPSKQAAQRAKGKSKERDNTGGEGASEATKCKTAASTRATTASNSRKRSKEKGKKVNEELFAQKYGLDELALRKLHELPPEKQQEAMKKFNPVRAIAVEDYSRVFMAFMKKLRDPEEKQPGPNSNAMIRMWKPGEDFVPSGVVGGEVPRAAMEQAPEQDATPQPLQFYEADAAAVPQFVFVNYDPSSVGAKTGAATLVHVDANGNMIPAASTATGAGATLASTASTPVAYAYPAAATPGATHQYYMVPTTPTTACFATSTPVSAIYHSTTGAAATATPVSADTATPGSFVSDDVHVYHHHVFHSSSPTHAQHALSSFGGAAGENLMSMPTAMPSATPKAMAATCATKASFRKNSNSKALLAPLPEKNKNKKPLVAAVGTAPYDAFSGVFFATNQGTEAQDGDKEKRKTMKSTSPSSNVSSAAVAVAPPPYGGAFNNSENCVRDSGVSRYPKQSGATLYPVQTGARDALLIAATAAAQQESSVNPLMAGSISSSGSSEAYVVAGDFHYNNYYGVDARGQAQWQTASANDGNMNSATPPTFYQLFG
ncbi:unnamed protein product [Amoebophrya sp. A120]|nr:unnamed protein product [Amoebophrya sp. A120]|eukprot:GSA120T00018517001.1